MVSFDELNPEKLRVVGCEKRGIPERKWEKSIEVRKAEPLRVELEEFIAWVEGKIGDVPFCAEDALGIIRALEEISPIGT